MVAVGVLLNGPGVGHQRAQAVIQVLAALTDVIDALHHLVGLIVGVGAGDALLIVLGVELLNQIAPLIIGASGGSLPAIITAAGDLVQVVQLVVHALVALSGLVGQVAKRVVGVGTVVVAIVLVNADNAVQSIVGIGVLHRGLASAVAPHILIGHVAAGIVLIDVLLLLHILLSGIGVLHL